MSTTRILIFTMMLAAASATLDVRQLTETAASKLHNITQRVASTVRQLASNAEDNLHEIANNIDYDKLKQLDVLQLIPTINKKIEYKTNLKNHLLQQKNQLLQQKKQLLSSKVQLIQDKKQLILKKKKALLSKVQSLHNKPRVVKIHGPELGSHFEYPYPVVTRKIVYIYE